VTRLLLRAPRSPFDVTTVADTLDRNLIANNSGNLVFIDASWKLLSAPGVEITADRLSTRRRDAGAINERYDAYVIPLANAFRLSFEPVLKRMTDQIRRLRIPVIVLGVGAQGSIDYGWNAIRPIERSVREFVGAVLDRSPSIGVRGEGTRAYLNGLGFRDVEVIGCPSMYLWGDHLEVERRAERLDAASRIAITISPYRQAMGPIAASALQRYPRLTYIAQDIETLALLVEGTPLRGGTPDSPVPIHPAHPLFQDRRARLYIDPWPWIGDLREMDFVFGTRIHGTIAALLAGTPATVLVHDSRTLELARYFDIPHRLLRDVPPDVDPADLYAEADFGPMITGHAARYAASREFLQRAGLEVAFDHPGAAEAFDARVAATAYPGPVVAGDQVAGPPRGPIPSARRLARRLRATAERRLPVRDA